VKKRPYVDYFLQKVSQLFEIVLFTTCSTEYTEQVIEKIDKHQLIDFRVSRHACIKYDSL